VTLVLAALSSPDEVVADGERDGAPCAAIDE